MVTTTQRHKPRPPPTPEGHLQAPNDTNRPTTAPSHRPSTHRQRWRNFLTQQHKPKRPPTPTAISGHQPPHRTTPRDPPQRHRTGCPRTAIDGDSYPTPQSRDALPPESHIPAPTPEQQRTHPTPINTSRPNTTIDGDNYPTPPSMIDNCPTPRNRAASGPKATFEHQSPHRTTPRDTAARSTPPAQPPRWRQLPYSQTETASNGHIRARPRTTDPLRRHRTGCPITSTFQTQRPRAASGPRNPRYRLGGGGGVARVNLWMDHAPVDKPAQFGAGPPLLSGPTVRLDSGGPEASGAWPA